METIASGVVQRRGFDSPDETRHFPNGRIDLVSIDGKVFSRATLHPGWRWSEAVKPIAGTQQCEMTHTGYIVSGTMGIRMADGAEYEASAGEVVDIPAGHDAWVVGSESVVFVEFEANPDFASRRAGQVGRPFGVEGQPS